MNTQKPLSSSNGCLNLVKFAVKIERVYNFKIFVRLILKRFDFSVQNYTGTLICNDLLLFSSDNIFSISVVMVYIP